MLLKMSDDHAAQVLADYPASLAGELIQAIVATRPRSAVTILQTLSAAAAGHAMDYLKPAVAASLLTEMTPWRGDTDPRPHDGQDRGDGHHDGAYDLSVQWIKAMQVKRAKAVLEYVKPVTVAKLLSTVPDDLRAMLLREFSRPSAPRFSGTYDRSGVKPRARPRLPPGTGPPWFRRGYVPVQPEWCGGGVASVGGGGGGGRPGGWGSWGGPLAAVGGVGGCARWAGFLL